MNENNDFFKATFPIEMTKEQILHINRMFDFIQKEYPFVPDSLSNLIIQLRKVIDGGCFKHKIICKKFNYEPNTTETICPKCDPVRYKELKSKYKEYDF